MVDSFVHLEVDYVPFMNNLLGSLPVAFTTQVDIFPDSGGTRLAKGLFFLLYLLLRMQA